MTSASCAWYGFGFVVGAIMLAIYAMARTAGKESCGSYG